MSSSVSANDTLNHVHVTMAKLATLEIQQEAQTKTKHFYLNDYQLAIPHRATA